MLLEFKLQYKLGISCNSYYITVHYIIEIIPFRAI